jgi:predicted HAD superfamily Cof-like phosphohydrolase
MNPFQADVHEFHCKVLGLPKYGTVEMRRAALRAELIREGAEETVAAIERGDLVEVIDGLVDLLVVVLGTADEWGLDLEPFWKEVHRTNMAKAGGPVRTDGKQLKPEGWKAPDIAGVLRMVGA